LAARASALKALVNILRALVTAGVASAAVTRARPTIVQGTDFSQLRSVVAPGSE